VNHIFRTATLRDIYRNLESRKFQVESDNNGDDDDKYKRQDQYIDDATEYTNDYEEGAIDGYVMQKPMPNINNGVNPFNVS